LLTRALAARAASLTVEPEEGWVVAAGCERGENRINIALLKICRAAAADDDAPAAEEWAVKLACQEFGVGRVSRGGQSRSQVNSVRFGWSLRHAPPPDAACGSAAAAPQPPPLHTGSPLSLVRVLLVGSQDRHVYVFPVPQPGLDGRLLPGEMRPLAVVPCPSAVNCAASSPDGRWLAATGDREEVYVTGSDAGFLERAGSEATATACVPQVLRLTSSQRFNNDLPAGCQYVAWSPDGARLAASSDTLHAVAVWAVPPRGSFDAFVPLARFSEHVRPVLALTFLPRAPGGAQLLAWAEIEANAYVADVDFAAASDAWRRPLRASLGRGYLRRCGVQRLRLPVPAPAVGEMLQLHQHQQLPRRITGLCLTRSDRLLVAQRHTIFEYSTVGGWSKEQHALFPAAFRAAVRTLLLAAAAPPPPPGEGPGVCGLPRDAIAQIIVLLAQPPAAWLPARPDAAAEADWLEQRGFVADESDAEEFVDDDDVVALSADEDSSDEEW
jgi:hypothetical protein